MKNPVYEQIQARKVKARLRMLPHAQRVSGNVSHTCRFFGVSRALFYIWKKRFEKNGLAGLRDQPRRPHRIRFRIPLRRLFRSFSAFVRSAATGPLEPVSIFNGTTMPTSHRQPS
jgi:hypothetical protein